MSLIEFDIVEPKEFPGSYRLLTALVGQINVDPARKPDWSRCKILRDKMLHA